MKVSSLKKYKERMKRKNVITDIENFEALIETHEDLVFGGRLYLEGIKYVWSHDKDIINVNINSFKNIEKREVEAISKAKVLLKEVKQGKKSTKELNEFEFPPIYGAPVSEITERFFSLVDAYEKIFPERSRNIPLTFEEHLLLAEEAMKDS